MRKTKRIVKFDGREPRRCEDIQGIVQGSKLTKKIQSQLATRYENLVAISQILVAKSPRCIVLSAFLEKNMSPQYICVKKPLKMANDRRNGAVHVTSQLNYSTITLSSEKIHSEKQNNFVIYLF